MTLKNRKLIVYIMGMVVLTAALILIIFFASTQLSVFIPWFIIGIIFLAALFVGGNVWKAYVTSKYFQPGLVTKVDNFVNKGDGK